MDDCFFCYSILVPSPTVTDSFIATDTVLRNLLVHNLSIFSVQKINLLQQSYGNIAKLAGKMPDFIFGDLQEGTL